MLPIDDRFETATRGVSPVIGVVMMIAVTVMLAAAISTFALDMGSEPAVPPQASWDFEWDGETNLTVAHDGGEPVDGSEVRIDAASIDEQAWLSETPLMWQLGDQATYDLGDLDPGDEIQLIWEPGDAESQVLARWQIPG